MAYAFYGEVIKLSYSDIGKWKLRYPKINLHHQLSRLDLAFQYRQPKNSFVIASQKIHYQNKKLYRVAKIPQFSKNPHHPLVFQGGK